MTSGAGLIASRLIEREISHLFGVMGDGNLMIIDEFVRSGGKHVAARHEGGAVAMADGYARATGRMGVATCTLGPGFTNTLTALTSARKGNSPLLLISGDTPSRPELVRSLLEVQSVSQQEICQALGLGVIRAQPNSIGKSIDEAIRLAEGDSCPVVLLVPKDLLQREVGASPSSSKPSKKPISRVDDAGLRLALNRIVGAKRPIVLAGRGAVLSDAHDDLVELSEILPALLGTTLRAKDYFRGASGNLDIVGGYSSELTTRLVAESDGVFVFGASMNDHTTKENQLLGAHNVAIRVDTNAGIGSNQGATLIDGDCKSVAKGLVEALKNRDVKADADWVAAARVNLKSHDRHTEYGPSHTDRGLDPRWLTMSLDESLPPRILIVDSGHFSGFANVYLHVDSPNDYAFAHDFGAVGLGLGTAIGTAIARPEKLVLLAIGDGGLMMSLPDLDTAAREGTRILILVMNDGGYGAEAHRLRLGGRSPEPALFQNPSLADVAQVLGVQALTVKHPNDLTVLPEMLRNMNGPILLECHLDPLIRSRTMDELYSSSAGARQVETDAS